MKKYNIIFDKAPEYILIMYRFVLIPRNIYLEKNNKRKINTNGIFYYMSA